MLEIFKEPGILEYELDIMVIVQDGREEKGRGSGVVREVLMSFLNECFSNLTVGALEKVPNVRHDYQKGEWEAIARIIVFGYSEVKYFPITLSPAFVPIVFFGEESLTPDFLMESFKLHVSQDEQEVIEKSLEGEFDFSDVDLLDLFR